MAKVIVHAPPHTNPGAYEVIKVKVNDVEYIFPYEIAIEIADDVLEQLKQSHLAIQIAPVTEEPASAPKKVPDEDEARKPGARGSGHYGR